MLSKLSTLFHSWARGWLILALFAAFVLFVAVTLPLLQAAPGSSIVSLDAQFFYTQKRQVLSMWLITISCRDNGNCCMKAISGKEFSKRKTSK